MKKDMIMWIAFIMMWVSVSVAVCYGIYITKSAWCLCAFILPADIKFSSKTSNEDKE